MSASIQIDGLKELQRKLATLPERVQWKVMRPAVSAAATPVLKSARQKAKKRSGGLRKSLGKKIVTNKKTQSVTAIIGPRKDFQTEVNGKPYKPSRTAHLVEKGFINAAGEHVPGQPFLNPALAETQGQALGVLGTKLGEGIEKEAAK